MTSIALECGYNDSSYFTRSFRKAMGITPGTYRKQLTL
jgi:AraC-like DNA-binding protein